MNCIKCIKYIFFSLSSLFLSVRQNHIVCAADFSAITKKCDLKNEVLTKKKTE